MKRKLLMLFAFFIGAILLVAVIAYVTAPQHYNVLVVGSDQRGTERARSDVLFVVSIPKSAKQQPFFLSIPRDTKVEHEEYGLQKINHMYIYGERPDDGKLLGNIDLTQHTVEELLDVKMDATIEVTFTSFAELIDLIGGTAVSDAGGSTGQTFNGVDTGALRGEELSGEEALTVIRDRFTAGRSDFDRQSDQREIFRSLLTKIKNPDTIRAVLDYFETSDSARLEFNKTKLLHFLYGAGVSRKGNVSIGEMVEESVPGAGGRVYTPDFGKELYYWIPDEAALQVIVDEHLK